MKEFNEIWVPTNFNKNIFSNKGITPNKIKVFGEPINYNHFSPTKTNKVVNLFLCLERNNKNNFYLNKVNTTFLFPFVVACQIDQNLPNFLVDQEDFALMKKRHDDLFVFLSVFKFEERKGYKSLISAFLSNFSGVNKYKKTILFMR